MIKRKTLPKLLFPLIAMMLLTGALLIERKGMVMEARGASLAMLTPSLQVLADVEDGTADVIVAQNSANETEMAFAKNTYRCTGRNAHPLPRNRP